MQCPVCVTETLAVTRRQDIQIDHCPRCGGVWLDRGELDKLLALDAEQMRSPRRYEDDGEAREQERIQRRARQYDDYDDEAGEGEEGGFDRDDERDGFDQPRGRGRYDRRPRDGYQGAPPRQDRGPGDEGGIDLKSIWREILENLGGGRLPPPR